MASLSLPTRTAQGAHALEVVVTGPLLAQLEVGGPRPTVEALVAELRGEWDTDKDDGRSQHLHHTPMAPAVQLHVKKKVKAFSASQQMYTTTAPASSADPWQSVEQRLSRGLLPDTSHKKLTPSRKHLLLSRSQSDDRSPESLERLSR